MISLYFNCRITNEKIIHIKKIEKNIFYPISYPNKINNDYDDQYNILKKTLRSYINLKFNVAILNIEIDNITKEKENEINKIIEQNIKSNNTITRFKRPSSKKEWKSNIEELMQRITKEEPILVMMNHDMPFIDYTTEIFYNVIKKTFYQNDKNINKALVYSFAPQGLEMFYGNTTEIKYDTIDCISEYSNNQASILIITIETLSKWLNNILCSEEEYIGRLIDWPGINYRNFKINLIRFPREFFKHYDGYGMVTGIRLITDLRKTENLTLKYPINEYELIEFYYQRWLDNYFLYVRDQLKFNGNIFERKKNMYINAVENSILLFRKGYLLPDISIGLIKNSSYEEIENKIRNRIYYDGNKLYNELLVDLELNKNNIVYQIYYNIKLVIKYIIRFKK